jgi:secretion/DNA translocation related CpaE-like protein
MAQLSPSRPVLVVAAPGETQDTILTAVAAQELDAEVITDPEQLGETWRTASTVIVADDHAERVAARALPHREGVYVVGAQPHLLSAWSAPLAARVIPLPQGAAWLGTVLGEGSSRTRAPVVAAIGGSGGVGASTLAAALAQLSAARGQPGAALVDADPLGGGIDLLLGAERVQGWRWPRLNAADGHLGDLRGYLPVVDGVSVVSMARGASLDLAREPLAAIVGSLAAWHSLVLLDPGRAMAPAAREAVRLSSRRLVVVAASVRGVAAARQTIAALDLEQAELVVRRTRGSLPSKLVAEALELPVLAELPDEPGLAGAAERGEPPARGARRGYRRAVEKLLVRLLPAGDADDD